MSTTTETIQATHILQAALKKNKFCRFHIEQAGSYVSKRDTLNVLTLTDFEAITRKI